MAALTQAEKKDFATEVHVTLRRLGIKHGQMAKKLRVHPVSFSRAINGGRATSPIVRRIAEKLHIPLSA